jgi:hypothetical protein
MQWLSVFAFLLGGTVAATVSGQIDNDVLPRKAIPSIDKPTFERPVGGRVLTFDRTTSATELEDAQTRSRWRISDGVVVARPLKGERLIRATAYPAFWFAWQGFFPRSAVWK